MRALLLGITVMFLFGCGLKDDEEDTLDQSSVAQVAKEVVQVTNDSYDQFSAEIETKVDGEWVTKTADGFSVKGTLTNAKGGSVSVEGSGKKLATGGYELKLTYAFSSWEGSVTGLTLDGQLSVAFTVESLKLPVKYSVTYSGSLTVGGKVSGSASFDFTLRREGPLQWSYCGTVSGFVIDYGTCP